MVHKEQGLPAAGACVIESADVTYGIAPVADAVAAPGLVDQRWQLQDAGKQVQTRQACISCSEHGTGQETNSLQSAANEPDNLQQRVHA